MIEERVIAGVRRAQANGIHCGRPMVEIDLRPALAILEKGHGLGVTAKALGVARSTLRRLGNCANNERRVLSKVR